MQPCEAQSTLRVCRGGHSKVVTEAFAALKRPCALRATPVSGSDGRTSASSGPFLRIDPLLTRLLAALVATSAFAAPALAQEPTIDTTEVALANNNDLILELGVGAQVQPRYLGSDDLIVSATPIGSIQYLNIPGLIEIGGGERTAFNIGPSFRFMDERDPRDDADLFGLRHLDRTYEVGLRASYEVAITDVYGAEAFGEARYAFGEAEGIVGGIGILSVVRPSDLLEIKVGPRVNFASDDYVSTYFSVTPLESFASFGRIDAYQADGGFYSYGLEANAKYEFRPDWFLNLEASYERLIGDAGDSPIVEVGSRDQFTAVVGLSRRFSFDLF